MIFNHHKAWVVCALCLVGLDAVQAQSREPDDSLRAVPVSARLGFETLKLPGDEAMGLLGGSYLLEFSPGWLAGPAVYGGATGHRGGFFVGGAELAYRLPLASRLRLETGLFVGGGGGGAAPVGGGLMLRPHLDLMWRLNESPKGPGVWAGVSASTVRFPNGDIRSSQAGVVLAMDSDFAYTLPSAAGKSSTAWTRGGMGFDRITVVGAFDRVRGSDQRIGLAGFRLDHWLYPNLYWGLEGAGAASGGAGGYAEVLATLGLEQPIKGTPLALGARAALGLGGGGAVPTDGGLLAKAGISISLHLSRDFFVSAEGGVVNAPQGPFRARYAQLSLGWDLDHPSQGPAALGRLSPRSWVEGMEWSLALEHVDGAARKDGPDQSMQSIGLQVKRSLTELLYISGQAHSAYNGDAGAYSLGLVGLGIQSPVFASRWSLGAELLVGAAGGGGIDTEGGAVVQPMLRLNLDLGPQSRGHLGLGRIRSLKGELDSPVLELAWGLAFGVPAR
jgi:hypothetical protein